MSPTTNTTTPLAHVEHGTGIPVLALHGWTPDHRLMLGCLEPVFTARAGYRRLYPDLPAMGATPAPESIASSDDILRAVQDFVADQIGDEPFLVVGESYGGYLGRALARSHRDQVLGLALICPIGTAVYPMDRDVAEHRTLRADPDAVAALAAQNPRAAAEYVELAVVQSPETARRFLEDVQSGLDAADHAAMARIREDWLLSTDPEGGEPYERPTLILTGRQDSSTGFADQYALLPHYPRASYVILDVAGHNLQIEQPVLFEALMLEWLERVAAES